MEPWRHQGVNVHGAALAGKAADGLESASGIQSRTLASLETAWDNGYETIQKGDVLVIDEAGMIGTRQLARITTKMQQLGAKLALVGDPDQLQPIEAGTPFRHLVDTHGGTALTEVHRQHEDWQKQASRDLAAGRIAEAVARYTKRKAVTASESRDHAIEALVESYTMDVAANVVGQTRLVFAHRRKDVHALIGDTFALRGMAVCSSCNVPLRSFITKGNGGDYPYYLCQTKRCDAYGKSIARDKIEGEVGALIKDLQPTQGLVILATAMFRHAWDQRRNHAKQIILSGKRQIKDIEKQTEALLARIMQSTNTVIIGNYEHKISELEHEKRLLAEKLQNQAEPKGTFEEKLEPLKSPYLSRL